MRTCSSPSLRDESRSFHGQGSHSPLAYKVEVEVVDLDLVGLVELGQGSSCGSCSHRKRKVLPRKHRLLDEARCRTRSLMSMQGRVPAVGVLGVQA
jgi:hypothetical protein